MNVRAIPAIISPELFDIVQIEFEKRKGQKRSTPGIFASKLICGDCGHFYGNKVWHSNSKLSRQKVYFFRINKGFFRLFGLRREMRNPLLFYL